jgi:hypothetical protein
VRHQGEAIAQIQVGAQVEVVAAAAVGEAEGLVVDAVRVVVNVGLLVDDPVIVTDGVGDGGASA